MAWNNKDPQYSTYGDYNDSQFYGAGPSQGDASAYDMFEEQNASAGQYASGWDPQATYGYYDPNAYQQPSPQPPVQPQQPRAGPSSTKGHPPPSGWGPKFEMNSRTWH